MGQTLSTPDTQKHSETGQNARFAYSVSEMQGWRIGMEDAHAAILELDNDSPQTNSFFAVYDGHGGATVAKFAGENVHQRLITEQSYKDANYEEALKRAFLGTDEDLLADPQHTRDPSGCTAVAALVTHDNKVYVANAGDSRSVISVKGEVKPLSYDHKPQNEIERNRITAAGGYIEYGRVNGNLALSRAIGDFEFKKNYNVTPEKQVITADPDLIVHDLTDEDEFLIIACDGIWDCLSNQQAVDFVRLRVSEGKELQDIGEEICEHLLAPDTSSGAGTGCDNMTVMIVAILNGKTKEEWYTWIADRVNNNHGYETPHTIPQLYPQSRVDQFRARRAAREERERNSTDRDGVAGGVGASAADFLAGGGPFGGFARILGSTGGISFSPGSGFIANGSNLMFGGSGDDSDDESMDDMELESGERSFFTDTLGLGRPRESEDDNAAELLKAKIEEFERQAGEDSEMSDASEHSEDHAKPKDSESVAVLATGTDIKESELHVTKLPPKLDADTATEAEMAKVEPTPQSSVTPSSSEAASVSAVPQPTQASHGDKWDPSVKAAEGLLDKSEDPTKSV